MPTYSENMDKIKQLDFKPLFGMSSPHLQMFFSIFLPAGKSPPSAQWLVDLGNGDRLSCEVSEPKKWNGNTFVLIHGLGGSHQSSYMVRMARKLYERGDKVVRINLRGCGSGKGLSKLPYNAGNSQDILKVLNALKTETPSSDITVIGFSLGANLALKLAGELGKDAEKLIKQIIAVCPPFDLENTASILQEKKNRLYNRYYLRQIFYQASPWTNRVFTCLHEYDDHVTGPLWGYKNAKDYYQTSSSKFYLKNISVPSHILSAEDDPFIALEVLQDVPLSQHVQLWSTKKGSHMGFLGRTTLHWMDQLLLDWTAPKKSSL